jgi:signal peptidase I
MSKRKPPFVVAKTSNPPPRPSLLARHAPSAASIRETIESIAIAFILAFLFRTFEAEAFVIPTGSMAPTLMGRHKDLACPICGYPFQVNASEEVDRDGRPRLLNDRVGSCTCPMCRYTFEIDDRKNPSYSGDRIIVNKFSYQLNDPKRWDVIVFNYPEEAHDNFIKRLAGLPNETLRIHLGDLWFRDGKDGSPKSGGEVFNIARKPPQKLLAMLQPVFDNDYMPAIAKYGWPARWQADPDANGSENAWTSNDYQTYQTNGAPANEVWLRYRHLVPSFPQWNQVQSGRASSREPVKPQLITDFAPYNSAHTISETQIRMDPSPDLLGMHWVGDLAVSADVELENSSGELILELVKGGRTFQCRLDLATGEARLSISGDDMQAFHPAAKTIFRGPGKYRVMFSNCDRELLLWVDDKPVKFDSPATYDDLHNSLPTPLDLTPIGFGSKGAKIKISHLKVFRDIYYIAVNKYSPPLEYIIGNRKKELLNDYIRVPMLFTRGEVAKFFSDPTQWSALEESNMREVEFSLKSDQYFALGDNSPKSRDSRLWNKQYWIDGDLLKGKALFIYWPHSWNRIPYVNIPFPFFPNFSRMHFIK